MTERIRRILRNLIIIFIVLLFTFSGYFTFQHFFRPDISVEKLISVDDPVILKIQNPRQVIRMLLQSGNLRGILYPNPADTSDRRLLMFLNKIVSGDTNSNVYPGDINPFLIFTDTGMISTKCVFAINLSGKKAHKLLGLFFSKEKDGPENTRIVHHFNKFEITEYRSTTEKTDIYTFTGRGLLLISVSRDALEIMVRRTMNPEMVNYPENLMSIAGKECDANLYLNFLKFDIRKVFPVLKSVFTQNGRFGNHAVFDLSLHRGFISINGITLSGKNNFLDLFSGQTPVKQDIWDILPVGTGAVTAFAFDKSELFMKNYLIWTRSNVTDSIPQQEFLIDSPLMESGSFSIITGSPGQVYYLKFANKNQGLEKLVSLAVNDPIDHEKLLNGSQMLEFTDLTTGSNWMKRLTAEGEQIRFGAFSGEFALFSGNETTLRSVIVEIQSGNLLNKLNWFTSVKDQISESANFTLLAFPDNYPLSDKAVSGFEDYFTRLTGSSQASCFQISNAENGYYSSLVCLTPVHDTASKPIPITEPSPATAPAKPGTRIILPQGNSRSKAAFFTFNDDDRLLTAYNKNGEEIFKNKCDGNILGGIFSVTIPGLFLFNTQSSLYCIQPDGTFSDGFPKQLPEKAGNGIAVMDYGNSQDYRILYCGVDNKVYNMDINGERVKGFREVTLDTGADKPVQHLVADKKDFLIITDKKGTATFLNRKGEPRLILKKPVSVHPDAIFYTWPDTKKGILFTLSSDGQLIFIDNKGELSKPELPLSKKIDRLTYGNCTGDPKKELICLAGNEIIVTDQKFRKVFNKEISGETFNELTSYSGDKKCVIAFYSSHTGKLILLDDKGSEVPIPSENVDDFEIFFDRNENKLKLITLKNHRISVSIIN